MYLRNLFYKVELINYKILGLFDCLSVCQDELHQLNQMIFENPSDFITSLCYYTKFVKFISIIC